MLSVALCIGRSVYMSLHVCRLSVCPKKYASTDVCVYHFSADTNITYVVTDSNFKKLLGLGCQCRKNGCVNSTTYIVVL